MSTRQHCWTSKQTLLDGAHSLFIHCSRPNNPNSLFYLQTMTMFPVFIPPSRSPTVLCSTSSWMKQHTVHTVFYMQDTYCTCIQFTWLRVNVTPGYYTPIVQPSNLNKCPINTYYLAAFCRKKEWVNFLMGSLGWTTFKHNVRMQ